MLKNIAVTSIKSLVAIYQIILSFQHIPSLFFLSPSLSPAIIPCSSDTLDHCNAIYTACLCVSSSSLSCVELVICVHNLSRDLFTVKWLSLFVLSVLLYLSFPHDFCTIISFNLYQFQCLVIPVDLMCLS